MSQSNLKVEKDGSLSVMEVPVATPPPTVAPTCVDLGFSAKEIMEFMDELRDNHKQLVEG